MRERPKVSSFEPRRLREAVRELERIAERADGKRAHETSAASDEKAVGVLRRWLRRLLNRRP